jgi:uncharacterized protein
MRSAFLCVMLAGLLLAGCTPSSAPPAPTSAPPPSATPSPTATPAPTLTPGPSPTADPYAKYTIEGLRSRTYGGGEVQVVERSGDNSAFTRYIIRYPSDGLSIAGFMDVPKGDGPFPVIIALHGYVSPSIYSTLDYTTHYADVLASNGYFVIHPNLRNFPPSDSGDDLFRVGMAADVLNLIGIVKQTGGKPGPLQAADPGRIGMWGHSMGGGITTRVITVSRDVKAAVLYAPMSGDEQKNYTAIGVWSNNQRGGEELAVAAQDLQRISPMYYFGQVTAAVSIHQGTADQTVPPDWSELTCQQMQALGRTVACHYYDGQPHTFRGQGDRQFIQDTLDFFDRYLR